MGGDDGLVKVLKLDQGKSYIINLQIHLKSTFHSIHLKCGGHRCNTDCRYGGAQQLVHEPNTGGTQGGRSGCHLERIDAEIDYIRPRRRHYGLDAVQSAYTF